jgi:hypothetical protein
MLIHYSYFDFSENKKSEMDRSGKRGSAPGDREKHFHSERIV